MKTLSMQKRLAAEMLGAGENKIIFDSLRLDDISKAITRADIADLIKDRAIMKKAGKSRQKRERRKRHGIGRVKVRVKKRKAKYVAKIRKLRRFISEMREKKVINSEEYAYLRKLAKSGQFKTRRYLKDYISGVMKKTIPPEAKR